MLGPCARSGDRKELTEGFADDLAGGGVAGLDAGFDRGFELGVDPYRHDVGRVVAPAA